MGAKDLLDFLSQNQDAIDELIELFSDYEPGGGVNENRLTQWLKQFEPQHRALALRLATHIRYYGIHEINRLMAPLHKVISQQIEAAKVPIRSVFFVPLGRTGESGEDIARRYRNVNKLHTWQDQFIKAPELPAVIFKTQKPLVFFLDDFIGTGDQVVDYWREVLSQLVPEYLDVYLAVIVAMSDGAKYVEHNCPIRVISVHTIAARQQLMSSANQAFSTPERTTICRYCKDAGNAPLGYGELGLLLSFAYGTPNNALSVIRGSKGQKPWRGLLPGWKDLQS